MRGSQIKPARASDDHSGAVRPNAQVHLVAFHEFELRRDLGLNEKQLIAQATK